MVTSTDTLHQVLQVLLYCSTVYIIFRVVLPRHSSSLYGELSFFPVGQLHSGQISFGPLPLIQKSTIESTSMVSPSMSEIICVRQIYGGLNSVFTLYSPWKHSTGMKWCEGRCTGQPKYQRHQEGCNFAIIQNSNTSMVVDSSLFSSFALVEQKCHHQLGALHP